MLIYRINRKRYIYCIEFLGIKLCLLILWRSKSFSQFVVEIDNWRSICLYLLKRTIQTLQDFEKFVMHLFQNEGQQNVTIQHNEMMKTSERTFQIDSTIRFKIMGIEYLTLVELKCIKIQYRGN